MQNRFATQSERSGHRLATLTENGFIGARPLIERPLGHGPASPPGVFFTRKGRGWYDERAQFSIDLTEAAAKGRPFSFRKPWVASSVSNEDIEPVFAGLNQLGVRPRGRAAYQRYELAPLHSIISSARASGATAPTGRNSAARRTAAISGLMQRNTPS